MSNFDLSNFAMKAVCPGNEILYDDKGMPSVMVFLPKRTYAELGMGASTAVHKAFIVNGQEVDGIYVSKYLNVIQNGRAYSWAGQDPAADTVDFDIARAACEAKGEGWHLMTRIERGMLIQLCQNNGFIPKGNNGYGKDSTETAYKAIPTTKNGTQIRRTATGTGPLTWYHDNSPAGIADLCGDVWEWDGGLRTVKGEVQVLANNNAADSAHAQGATSAEWKAIKASDGTLITPDGSGTTSGSVKMDWISSKLTYSTTITDSAPGSHSCTFANVVANSSIGDAAKLLLQELGLLPYSGSELYIGQTVYFNNAEDERLFFSGGSADSAAYGFASFYGHYPRSNCNWGVGFRSAYVKLPSA